MHAGSILEQLLNVWGYLISDGDPEPSPTVRQIDVVYESPELSHTSHKERGTC